MINESNLSRCYSEIANKLNEIIPVKWEKVAMYAEESGDVSSASFYFYTEEKEGKLIEHNSGNLKNEYNMSDEEFNSLFNELFHINKKLWLEFKKGGEKTWDGLIFKLDSNGKFKIKFVYDTDEKVGYYERMIIWAYDDLGIVPKGKFGMSIVQDYLKSKGEKLKFE